MASLLQPSETYCLHQRRAAEGGMAAFAEGAQKVLFLLKRRFQREGLRLKWGVFQPPPLNVLSSWRVAP